MKLLGSVAGLAAVLSLVPYKVEKKECGEKKSYSLTSLTWKAEYTPSTETEESGLTVDLLGGLLDTVEQIKKIVKKEEAPPCEEVGAKTDETADACESDLPTEDDTEPSEESTESES